VLQASSFHRSFATVRCGWWMSIVGITHDLPPAGPAVIMRVRWFDIRVQLPAQARRARCFHLAGTPGALELAFGFPGMSAA
jgi:hypothetical protein